MKGAIVFLTVFIILLAATLTYTDLPPGRQLYDMLGVQETDYEVLGIPTTNLVSGVFNGIIYGVIAWLIFTLIRRKKKEAE